MAVQHPQIIQDDGKLTEQHTTVELLKKKQNCESNLHTACRRMYMIGLCTYRIGILSLLALHSMTQL